MNIEAALTTLETTALTQHEATIERGLKTFVEVGGALLAIRDGRLYRAHYGTFEDYCRERWNLSKPYATQLIAAAGVVENLVAIATVLPATESQARPLTSLPPDVQPVAWQRAVETAPNGKITAAHVQGVVDDIIQQRKPLLQAYSDGDALTPQQERMVPKFQRLAELEEQGVYIGSVWAFERRADYAGDGTYHGNSIPQIVENAVLLYTAEGDTVLDPMAGSGTTIDVCNALGRNCLAFDVQAQMHPGVLLGDARSLPVPDESIDLVFWHPPYWNMVVYSRAPGDISALPWSEFLNSCSDVLTEVYRVLRPGGTLILLSGDKVQDGRFYPIARRLANLAEDAGFYDKGVAIKTTENSTSQIIKGKTIWAELAYSGNLKVEHDTVNIFGRPQ